MKIRQLINSVVASISQSSDEGGEQQSKKNIPDYASLVSAPDILGQSSFRLIYPIHSPAGAHSEEYKTALRIAEEFDKIVDYKGRMDFWDAHYTVFGLASIVAFDTEKEVYGWHHGYPQGKLTYGLDSEEECFRAFSVLPSNEQELVPFMLWCLEKRRNKVEIPTIMDVGYYWKQIGKSQDPASFLTNLLNAAEAHSDKISQVVNPWAVDSITDTDAKNCFFYYGKQDAIYGETAGPLGSAAKLFQVLTGIITCPLSTYGELFFQYDDGFHTAAMVGFLRGQKKRLDGGEDISVSADVGNKYPPEREPTFLTPTKTLSSLLRSSTRYDTLAQMAALSGLPLLIYAPDYKLAQRLYDKRFPDDTNREDKIWISYHDSYADFEEEFDHKIDSLFQDRDGRIAYIRRVFDQLHAYPPAAESLNRLVANLCIEPCLSVKRKLDLESFSEITEIINVLNASITYIKAVSVKIERQLEIEGIPLEDGWLSKERKAPAVDSTRQPTTELELTSCSFAELFFSHNDLQRAINILYETTLARKFNIIDPKGKWLGKERDGSRSVLLAWVEVLESRGWFRLKLTNKQKTELLNAHFEGLNLSITDDSLWRKQKDSSIANKYHPDFLQLIKVR